MGDAPVIYLYLALGGAAGTLARFGISGWIGPIGATDFPWGTFSVNIAGSLLLGLLMRWLEASAWTADTRALLTVGFCGAFTTFSTFSLETLGLLQAGAWGRAALYAFGSVSLGLVAVGLGFLIAGPLVRPAG